MHSYLALTIFTFTSIMVLGRAQQHWGPSASFDCEMRKLAYQYGKKLIPRAGAFPSRTFVVFFSFSRRHISSSKHTYSIYIIKYTHTITTPPPIFSYSILRAKSQRSELYIWFRSRRRFLYRNEIRANHHSIGCDLRRCEKGKWWTCWKCR